MKAKDMLQCGECKAALEEFIEKSDLSEAAQEILAQFAVFMELRRLRENKVGQTVIYPDRWVTTGSPMVDPVFLPTDHPPGTIIC